MCIYRGLLTPGVLHFFAILGEPLAILGFVPSRTFYASAILNEPLAFQASFLPERFTLPQF
jgi:hypothetical protein